MTHHPGLLQQEMTAVAMVQSGTQAPLESPSSVYHFYWHDAFPVAQPAEPAVSKD